MVTHLEKEDKLKFVVLIAEYSKVLANVKISSQTSEATYENYANKDKVASILVTNDEAKLKEF